MKKIFYGIEHSIPAMKSFAIGLDEERLNMVDTVMEHYSKKITSNYKNISKGTHKILFLLYLNGNIKRVFNPLISDEPNSAHTT